MATEKGLTSEVQFWHKSTLILNLENSYEHLSDVLEANGGKKTISVGDNVTTEDGSFTVSAISVRLLDFKSGREQEGAAQFDGQVITTVTLEKN